MYREECIKQDIDTVNQDLIFQALDWYSSDVTHEDEEEEDEAMEYVQTLKKNDEEYTVKVFGVDEKGRSIGVTVNGFKPFMYICIPGLELRNENTYVSVSRNLTIDNPSFKIVKVEREEKINLYGFRNNESEMYMKLYFKSEKNFRSAVYNLKQVYHSGKKYDVVQYESNIDPMLRLIHLRDIQPSGWIKIEKSTYNKNYEVLASTTTIDVTCDWTDLTFVDRRGFAPLVIASYDIECTSSHGDFPQAVKSYNKTSREFYEYFKSLTSCKKKIMTKEEVKTELINQLLMLFEMETNGKSEKKVLTYVISKNEANKGHLMQSIPNHMDDLIHMMKYETNTEKYISEFFKKDLKIGDPKILIKNLKELYTRLEKKRVKEHDIMSEVKREILNSIKSKLHDYNYYRSKINSNQKVIMKLFRKQTIFDKISEKFVLMGFPLLEGDPIIQIGTTFHLYGEKQCFYKHVVTLKDCDENFDCDEIVECKTERGLLLEWRKMVLRMDPDILTGYNIFGFDNGYIHERTRELMIESRFENIGRLKKPNYGVRRPSFIVKELQSSALGQNILKYFAAEGRVQIDLMKIIQKEFKLDTYKLDHVASNFINGDILNHVDSKTIEIDNTQGLFVNNFVVIDGTKFKVKEIDGKRITLENDNDVKIEGSRKWGMVKDDITPNQIFESFNGSAEDRATIAKYCLQDCTLCNYLMMKLEIIANNVGMSNVCLVPLAFVILRGQGVKIFSLVAKQCLDDGFIIPVVRRVEEDVDESYEGAIVLDPEPGIYEDPVAVLDFASLYPSSMISENISHDSIVLDEKYNNIPGINYIDITYDVNGSPTNVRFAEGEDKGVLPRILMKLLSQRKKTRKKISYKTLRTKETEFTGIVVSKGNKMEVQDVDTKAVMVVEGCDVLSIEETYNEFEKAVLDGLQLAFKITANSLYGSVGAKTSPIFLKELAASTTATGRNLVLKLRDFAEETYDCKVIYGDSVMPYTPIIVMDSGRIRILEISNLCEEWKDYPGFLCDGDSKQQSETSNESLKIWTHDGWKQIRRVIRHKCQKKIYRITTETGLVDVTEDHSLLGCDLQILKPDEINSDTKLYQSFPSMMNPDKKVHHDGKLFVLGVFLADGQICGEEWSIIHVDEELLLKCRKYLEADIDDHNGVKFEIVKCKNYLKLVEKITGKKSVAKAWFESCYEKGCKIVPSDAYGNESVLNGLWECHGRYRDFCNVNFTAIDFTSQISAQSFCAYVKSLDYQVSIRSSDGYITVRLSNEVIDDGDRVRGIEVLHERCETFVYDLETESGSFHAGIGDIVLKNTDSIFVKFNKLTDAEGNELVGKSRLQATIDTSIELSKAFKPHLKEPHDAEYEKTFYPFVILSKKRYVGNLYEMDVNKFKQKSMGVVLKRRDNAKLLKKIYGGMIEIILNENDIQKAIKFLQKELALIQQGKVAHEDLVISKTLKSDYADPSRISHKVLSDRMHERNDPHAPQVNDRVQYIYIVNSKKDALQGERIEHPEYIERNNVKIDYSFYITNQILKPVSQLLALRVEQIDGYRKDQTYYDNIMKDMIEKKKCSKQEAIEKVNALKEKEVSELLFEPVLREIRRKMKNQTTINDFFSI